MTSSRIFATAAFMIAAPLQAQQTYPPLHVDPSLKECSIEFASTLTQHAFHRFSREFGSVSAFKQLGSPTTLRPGQVSIGLEMSHFAVDETSPAWNDTFAHPNDHHPLGDEHDFPKIKLGVGVSDNFELGGFYSRNPNANYGWAGIDGKYRLATESEASPLSVAVRGAYTKTLFVKDMDMHAVTTDISVGRRFSRVLTPFVGLGADGVYARETSNAVNLRNEMTVTPHAFGGLNATLLGRLNIQAEYTLGALPSAQVQIGAVAF